MEIIVLVFEVVSWGALSYGKTAANSNPANQQGKEFVIDVPAGPILNNEDAQTKCPIVCASHSGKWNGQWKTVVEGQMSVCGCVLTASAN